MPVVEAHSTSSVDCRITGKPLAGAGARPTSRPRRLRPPITSTYVVLKIRDERRLVIPLQWFIDNPFQNWTHTPSQIIGSVFFWMDCTTELEPLRTEATRLARGSKDFDGRVCLVQVVDTSERAMKLRLIVSSPSAGQSWTCAASSAKA